MKRRKVTLEVSAHDLACLIDTMKQVPKTNSATIAATQGTAQMLVDALTKAFEEVSKY